MALIHSTFGCRGTARRNRSSISGVSGAEAHSALGLYHAEILDKVGAMIGGLTYGAKSSTGLEHFERALELTPDAPIAHVEYANGLKMMFGKKRQADAAAALDTAGGLKARDAMEALDIERAKSELED